MNEGLRRARLAIAALLLALLGIFAAQNTAEVDLTFLTWTVESRRIVVIAISFAIGLGIGLVYGLTHRRRG